MEIKRDLYLNRLIRRERNGMIKVVTGFVAAENHISCSTFFTITCCKKEYPKIISLRLRWTIGPIKSCAIPTIYSAM